MANDVRIGSGVAPEDELFHPDIYGAVQLEPKKTFDQSIVGRTYNADGECVIVYDYWKIVEAMEEEMPTDEAIEYVEYNTIRAIAYMGSRRPVILYSAGIEC